MATKKQQPAVENKLVRWDEKLAALAKQATKTEEGVGGGSFIGTAGGRFRFRGAEVPNNTLDVVVIDHILENGMYEGRYDPDNPSSPVCFAFGRTDEEMRPHEKSSKPQAERCADCEANKFGSAETGKGKACKNIRRMALITEGDLENIEAAEVAYLKIPVMSVKGWAGFVRSLESTLNLPPLGVVTTLNIVTDTKCQFRVTAAIKEKIEDGDVIGELLTKNEQAQKDIAFPYEPPTEPAPAPAKAPAGKRKFTR